MPSLEDWGFSRTHRRDGNIDADLSLPENTFSTDITEQLTQTEQYFPTWSLTDELIDTINVNKLVAGTITSQKINLAVTADGGDIWIAAGKTDFDSVVNGFILGIDDSDSDKVKFHIGDSSSSMDWNETTANTLTITNANITGTLTAGELHIPDENTTANSFHTDTAGNSWWGATHDDFTSNNNNASAYILKDGTARFKSAMTAIAAVINNSSLTFQDIFGDGSDGTVTISANTTLTTDMFYDDLTIDATKTLFTGGYRVHVKGTLTVNGTIGRAGNAGGAGGAGGNGVASGTGGTGGTAGAAGTALADGSIAGALAGVIGSVGPSGTANNNAANAGVAGSNGSNKTKSLTAADGVDGVSGGDGGKVTDGSGSSSPGGVAGTGGTKGTVSGTVYNKPNTAVGSWLLQDFSEAAVADNKLQSSASSASGGSAGGGRGRCTTASGGRAGGGGAGGSGGSGSVGGISPIFAKVINVTATGVITNAGGAGGDGGAGGNGAYTTPGAAAPGGGGSGGSGGSGGVTLLVYSSLTNAGSITAAGGAGGAGGSAGATGDGDGGFEGANWGWWAAVDGTVGTNGVAGAVIQLQV